MPTSTNRRSNGTLHLKKGPIPYRIVKVPPKEAEPPEADAQAISIPVDIQDNVGLESILAPEADKVKHFGIGRSFAQGPRDLHNMGKNHKFMIIPEFADHAFFKPKKGPDGRMGLTPDVRKIPLHTLAPRGKAYARGVKRGGPGTQTEAGELVSVANA